MGKASKPVQRSGPYKRNTGRKELRGSGFDMKAKKHSRDQYQEPEPESESGSEVDDGEDISQEASSGLSAYNALLTLLKPEDEIPAKKVQKKSKRSTNNDNVEGLEEDAEQENDEQDDLGEDEIQIEDDNEGDLKDPFESHFATPDEKALEVITDPLSFSTSKFKTNLGDKSRIDLPETPLQVKSTSVKSIDAWKLKYRLKAPFQRANGDDLTSLQRDFGSLLFAYRDVLLPNRTVENSNELQSIYTLHAINHIYKTRDRVLKNNAKLSAAAAAASKNSSATAEIEYRDQGFTRPKVLVLLPTKHSCWKFINNLMEISGLNQSENKKRFKDAFYEDAIPPASKPKDFRDFFTGNTDDLFCLGVKFTRQAIKLYSSFYSSDLIVASPLGLQRIVGNSQKPDYDFLSSIEVLILDQADGVYFQNWENVDFIFKNMNLTPKEAHGCDFSRVREWYIHQKAKFLRQTIIITDYTTPEMNHTMSQYCHNLAGKVRVRQADQDGVMSRIGTRIRQTFTRLHSPSPVNDPDARFQHFTAVILPSLLRRGDYKGTLIYIPSYNDFIRVRRYTEMEKIDCACVSEYDEASHISRARTLFAAGRVKILIISERFHHYRRFELKGVHQVIMYGVPQNPKFYAEVMRFMVRTAIENELDLDMLQGRVLYSKFDNIALQRIVGTKRNGVLMQGSSDTYEFH